MNGSRRLLTGALLTSTLVIPITAATGRDTAPPKVAAAHATSEWPCPHWGMYGRGLGRTFSTDCPSDIDSVTVRTLAPAWFVKLPAAVSASPVVVDGVLYVGAWDGHMYALDAETGAKRWEAATIAAPGANWGPIVSSAAVADVLVRGTVRRLVVFGAGPRVYALDASDGSEVWVKYVGGGVADEPTQVESSPAIWNGTVYVGMDTHNEFGDPTGGVRGGLLALNAATGTLRWRFDPELDELAKGCGGVWSSPAIDLRRRLVFFGSANCPNDDFDWTPYTVAVTALDADSGAPVWSFQPNRPPDRDLDFGATPNLFVDGKGRETLGAGGKDGTYYALDPSTGSRLWSSKVQEPVDGVGGFIGSPAVSGGRIFGGTGIGSAPYYHAIDADRDGEIVWQGAQAPSYGASAVVNGVVFSGPLDPILRAYDAETGVVLWAAPLSAPPSSGPAIVGNSVFIGTGTSSTDLCAKGSAYDEPCRVAFDGGVRRTGGVHAFRLVAAGT